MSPKKNIVFDVVGTCVSFAAYHDRIDAVIGLRLLEHNITAKAFGYTWMTAAELEFTFLSISGRYKPYGEILAAVFYRTLYMMGVAAPRAFCDDTARDECIDGYSSLRPRDDLAECFAMLRAGGFEVWCLTSGDIQRVQGYFAAGAIDMPKDSIITCDINGIAKPDLDTYRPVLERFAEDDQKWFAAAHMWDVSAAKKVGFRGAYCSVYETENCIAIYDTEMDVMAEDLVEMAKKVVEASK